MGEKIGSLEGCPPYGLICCVTNTRPIALCRVSDGVIHPLKVLITIKFMEYYDVDN